MAKKQDEVSVTPTEPQAPTEVPEAPEMEAPQTPTEPQAPTEVPEAPEMEAPQTPTEPLRRRSRRAQALAPGGSPQHAQARSAVDAGRRRQGVAEPQAPAPVPAGIEEVETKESISAMLDRVRANRATLDEAEAQLTAALDKIIEEESPSGGPYDPHKTTRDIRGYLDGQLAAMEGRSEARDVAAERFGADLGVLKPSPLEAHLSTRKPAPRSTQVAGGKE